MNLNHPGPHYTKARKTYKELTDEQKANLHRKYARHLKACRTSGIAPDILWLPEAVEDAARGLL